MRLVKPSPNIVERTYITPGLVGQDDNIDLLQSYFKEMQKTTVETSNPEDFLSFASCAHFFGVVMLETTTTPVEEEELSDEDPDAEGEPESEDISESIYPASSRATSPPASNMSSAASNSSMRSPMPVETSSNSGSSHNSPPTQSEQEKILLWREAFLAKLEEDSDEPLIPAHEEDGVLPIYASKGKFPEPPSPFLIPHRTESGLFSHDPAGSSKTHEDSVDYINWPDEGSSSHPQEGPSSSAEPMLYAPMDIYSEPPVFDKEFGREYLEPEVYSTPLRELPDLPTDPQVQAFIYDSAIKFRDELRAKRIREYQASKRRKERKSRRPPAPPPQPWKTLDAIGLVYLWTSQTFLDPLHMGECSMGVYIKPEHRGKECLLAAANQVVEEAFKDPECHRLQSIIVENPDKLYNLELLARAGFRNEGIRRRAFYSTVACEWKDVTYFAMLATDYVYDNNNSNSSVRLRPKSLWEEVFARHQKECDDLVRLEERSTLSLKRSSSVETIRERISTAVSLQATDSESTGNTTDTASSIRSYASSKRRRLDTRSNGQSSAGSQVSASTSENGLDSEWEVPGSRTAPLSIRRVFGNSSIVGPSNSRPRRRSVDEFSNTSSGSASSSQWVVLDE